MPAYQTSLLLSKVASLVRASHPEVVVTFPNILGSKLSCSILMIIPIVFTCWSYFDTDGCVWEWGIPSKMVVLVGKMVINYIEIGYDKSTSSLLKWQCWMLIIKILTHEISPIKLLTLKNCHTIVYMYMTMCIPIFLDIRTTFVSYYMYIHNHIIIIHMYIYIHVLYIYIHSTLHLYVL